MQNSICNLNFKDKDKKKTVKRLQKSHKKGITIANVLKMRLIYLSPKSFQRSARPFYKTTGGPNSVYLLNQSNGNSLNVEFTTDQFGYIKLTFRTSKNSYFQNGYWLGDFFITNIEIKKPTHVRDLFIKILRFGLL